MKQVQELRDDVPVTRACRSLSFPRSTYYSRLAVASRPVRESKPRPRSSRALSEVERELAIATMTSDEFVDKAPASIVAGLLDRGVYICSVRTLYRLLAMFVVVMERRSITRHTNHNKPELLATGARQLFTWDITKLKGPQRGEVFNLYVMIDVYSRYVVGWLLANREQDDLARDFLETTCKREGIREDQLIIHADNGPAMRSSLVAELLDQMRVCRSHSRPYCSNDNPYIEAHFKTLKYSPGFPERFNSIEEARAFCIWFFDYYNNYMYHSGIEMLTPAMVHFGKATQVVGQRQQVLNQAFELHPERFVKGVSTHKFIPEAVYINKPDAVAKGVLIL